MKKVWGTLAIVSFVALTGLPGGLDSGSMTMTQFLVSSIVILGIFGFSLSKLSKHEWKIEEED
ncbi:hypothetical protein [Niameybacter massiliensis]|uniref:hypothetical protein n=1 Tax=Niameybacter massiliensis TaxID=1658108 RepID=UPI0006B5DC5E|nr:hypothetical protein [Niameybacter massiliensis]